MTTKDLDKQTIEWWKLINETASKYNILFDIEDEGGALIFTATFNDGEPCVLESGITDLEDIKVLILSFFSFVSGMRKSHPHYYTFPTGYTEISGGTHDMPALIASLTDEKIYFRNTNWTYFDVDEPKEGIDYFRDKEGVFVVDKGRKAIAEWKVRMHDDFGVEW